jgi:hypothetical protein
VNSASRVHTGIFSEPPLTACELHVLVSAELPPSRDYKRTPTVLYPASHRHSHLPLPLLRSTSHRHRSPHHRELPPAEPHPQATTTQGEHGVEIPSAPLRFSPIPSRLRPPGCRHPLSTEATTTPPPFVLDRGKKKGIFAHKPLHSFLSAPEPSSIFPLFLSSFK